MSLFLKIKNRLSAIFYLVRQRSTLPGPGWVQVPSMLVGLTSVFEKGTGVTPLLSHRLHRVTELLSKVSVPNQFSIISSQFSLIENRKLIIANFRR